MDRIASYSLDRRLGDGAVGALFAGEQADSALPVLVEVLRDELAQRDAVRRGLRAIVPRLKRLAQPNVLPCVELCEEDRRVAIVHEAVEGPSLREMLDHAIRLPWEEAAHVALSVARGLAAAHAEEPAIVHGELRPERLFATAGGSVVVMGFGVAAAVDAAGDAQSRTVETLRYLSPEQIDAGAVDGRTDLYGLGLLLYELLAGHPPFQSSSLRTLANMQCTEAPVPLPRAVADRLPKGLHDLLSSLLEKDRVQRPASARQVAGQLEAFVSDRARELLSDRVRQWSTADPAPYLARRDGASGDDKPSPKARSSSSPSAASADSVEPSSAPPGDGEDSAAGTKSSGQGGAARWLRWPSELSTRQSVLIIAGFTLVAALATYGARGCSCAGPPAPTPMQAPPRPLQTVAPGY